MLARARLLYRLRDDVLLQTAEGRRYVALYYAHSAEIARLMLTDTRLERQGLTALDALAPGVEALLAGKGHTMTITKAQVKQAEAFLDALSAAGSLELQKTIAEERARRPLSTMIDTTFEEAWDYLNKK